VTIPRCVTNIEPYSFGYCHSLTEFRVDTNNPAYSSVDGVLFDKDQTTLIQCPGGRTGSYKLPDGVTSIAAGSIEGCAGLTNVTIPCGVTNIGGGAFYYCTSLTTMTIPKSVTSIQGSAFAFCTSLTGVYFQGDAPGFGGSSSVFYEVPHVIVYYLPGTTNWTSSWEDRPALLWNPQAQTGDANFGVRTNQFGFTITGTPNIPLVLEACTNLAVSDWVTLQSCTLTNGSIYFNDPEWTNHPSRIYRIRSP
jgi:hypothetical protein